MATQKRKTTRRKKQTSRSAIEEFLLQMLRSIPQSVMNALVLGGLVVALLVGAYFLLTHFSVSVSKKSKVGLSPTVVERMEAIGQWEFLAVSDEEIVDTVRSGYFRDDELVRIYKGTLRLGIDMADAADDWIQADGDTIRVVLPPVKLLDENFLDETATKSFYETGKWSQKDRKNLAEKARRKMKKRCLTPANLNAAKQSATSQFRQMLASLGFEHVDVKIAGPPEQR